MILAPLGEFVTKIKQQGASGELRICCCFIWCWLNKGILTEIHWAVDFDLGALLCACYALIKSSPSKCRLVQSLGGKSYMKAVMKVLWHSSEKDLDENLNSRCNSSRGGERYKMGNSSFSFSFFFSGVGIGRVG